VLTKNWPEFPKVRVVDFQIVIEYEDGAKQYWSDVRSESESLLIASDIQEGLRALHYISTCLNQTLTDCLGMLEKKGYPEEQAVEYLADALGNALHARITKPGPKAESQEVSGAYYIH
jgi:hypothetical protein